MGRFNKLFKGKHYRVIASAVREAKLSAKARDEIATKLAQALAPYDQEFNESKFISDCYAGVMAVESPSLTSSG